MTAKESLVTKRTTDSPYLRDSRRLSDVLAAIQAMGSYKFYKLDFARWADRITGDSTKGDYWRTLFEQHPEFFRLDSTKEQASLIWRRQYPKLFHVDRECKITRDEFIALSAPEKARVSRVALSADDIHSLMQAAIDLHSRAIEQQRERRWWIPLIASAAGGLVGALVGAAFGS
jgi:hypothetical protein